MLKAHQESPPLARPILTSADVVELQSVATRVHVEDDLLEYVAALAAFTRGHQDVLLGASPRGSLALVTAAKGLAVVRGRSFVTPDDVQALAPQVFAHRLVLAPELEGRPEARERVVQAALAKVSYRRAVRAV